MIIPDGLTDLPLKSLQNKTPLDQAKIPNIDFLLKNGFTGAVKNVPPHKEPGSDVANLSLLGVNSNKIKVGRGTLEALAQNIPIHQNETILRLNFVTIKDDIMLDNTGGEIKTEEAAYFIKQFNRHIDHKVKFFPGVGYRNLIILNYPKLKIHTIPPHDIMNKKVHDYLPEGKDRKILIQIMQEANSLLKQSPFIKNKKIKANAVWLWGEGHLFNTPSFLQKYKLKGAVISAVDIIRGIGKLLKMDIIKVPGITGDFHTNYKNKALYALKNLYRYDFIFVHIEAPDEAGHKGDYREKIKAIEKIDKEIVQTLLKSPQIFTMILLPDHPTPVQYRTHINKAVPFILYSKDGQIKTNHTYHHYSENILKNPPVFIREGYTLLEKIFTKKIYGKTKIL